MVSALKRNDSAGLSFLEAGRRDTARPLVLLHGIGSNAASFTSLMHDLSVRRPLIAWDAPGYATSQPLAPEWPSADDYAAALVGLLDRIGLGRIDLLGHSMGALIAGRFAALQPKRVGRLILASPALGYATRPGEALAPAAGNRLEAFLKEGGEKFAAKRGPRLVHARHHAALVAGVVKAMSEVKLPGYAQASRMLSCADLIGEAARIANPTLVVVGGEDEITPPANCRRLFDALMAASPGLGHRWEVIPDAGHALPQERPQALGVAIEDFAPPVAAGD